MSKLRRAAVLALLVALPAAFAGTASAKTRHKAFAWKVFTLKAGTTKTFYVAYPYALKYGNAKYGAAVDLSPLPNRAKVLYIGPAQGGSVLSVKVRNGRGGPTASILVTATTTWYS